MPRPSTPNPPTRPSLRGHDPDASAFAVVGRLIDDGIDHGRVAIVVDGGKVVARRAVDVDGGGPLPARCLRAPIVSPGFVDLQVNGGFGFEVGDDARALTELARRLPETGVTAFLPTLVSRPEEGYRGALAACGAAAAGAADDAASAGVARARIAGVHLEGPLLALERAGAHDRDAIATASSATLTRILAGASPEAPVVLVTLAPERDGALELVSRLAARQIAVSVGHTEASFELATRAVDAGARLATHVWNAMPPLHHRAPGAVGAALGDARVTALFIADGAHVHPTVLGLSLGAKPPGRRAIVTDSITAAGLHGGATSPTGATLAGRALRLDGRAARLPDGTLAGATVTLDAALRNVRAWTALGDAEALRLVTSAPGGAIAAGGTAVGGSSSSGLRLGRLGVGDAADLVLLDDALVVLATFVGGELAYVQGGDVDALRA
jgi:N-acetylglucosamine-6-phosphate deacetylase